MSKKYTYHFSSGSINAIDIYYSQIAPFNEEIGDYEIDNSALANLLEKINENEEIEYEDITSVIYSCNVDYTPVCGQLISWYDSLKFYVKGGQDTLISKETFFEEEIRFSDNENSKNYGNKSPGQFTNAGEDVASYSSPLFGYCGDKCDDLSLFNRLLFKNIGEDKIRERFLKLFPNQKDSIMNDSLNILFKNLLTFKYFEGMSRDEFLDNPLISVLSFNGGFDFDLSEAPEVITSEYCSECAECCPLGGYNSDNDCFERADSAVCALFYDLNDPGIYVMKVDTLDRGELTFEFESDINYKKGDFKNFSIDLGHVVFTDHDDQFWFDTYKLLGCCIEEAYSSLNVCVNDGTNTIPTKWSEIQDYTSYAYGACIIEITKDYNLNYICTANLDHEMYDVESRYQSTKRELKNYFALKEILDASTTDSSKSTESAPKKNLTKAQSIAIDFWTRLNEKISEKGSQLSTRKPNTDSWYNFAVGSSKACVRISLASREKWVSTDFWIFDNKELFDELAKNKKEIERKLKFSMDWDRKDGYKAASISLRIYDVDLEDRQSWDSLIDDLIVKCELFQNVFKEYLE